MYNLLSLALGLGAWGFGIGAVAKCRNWVLPFCSFSLCCTALVFQVLEVYRLAVIKDDYAAIQDTAGGIVFAAVALVSVTLALNGTALLRKYKSLK